MNEETIVAVYDTVEHADAAVRDLEAAHVPSGAISRHSSATLGVDDAGGASAMPAHGEGFWNDKFGGRPEHDTAVYDRSVESGSTVVMVRVPDEHVEAVSRILELHNPVDMDERASGYALDSTGVTTAPVPSTPTATSTGTGTDEQVIPLTEEKIDIGKRLVDRGTTRVRRFVVETPVEQNVTLRSEHATIERRPAGPNARASDTDFTDHVIEVKETDEEAIVGKTAHVREEVVIRKDVTDRVETIHDTVRREDVEIEKTPGDNTTARGTTPRI